MFVYEQLFIETWIDCIYYQTELIDLQTEELRSKSSSIYTWLKRYKINNYKYIKENKETWGSEHSEGSEGSEGSEPLCYTTK